MSNSGLEARTAPPCASSRTTRELDCEPTVPPDGGTNGDQPRSGFETTLLTYWDPVPVKRPQPNNAKKWDASWTKKIVAFVWGALFLAAILGSTYFDLSPKEGLIQLIPWLKGSVLGPVVFIGLYTLLPLVFFSPTVLTIFSGVGFGPVWGVVYTLLGTMVSSSVAYRLGNFLGGTWLAEKTENSSCSRWISGLRSNGGFESVLMMRLLFVPFDLVNYLAGAVGIRFKSFMSATVLGSIAPIILFVQLGHATGLGLDGKAEINLTVLAASVVLILLGLGASRKWKSHQNSSLAPSH